MTTETTLENFESAGGGGTPGGTTGQVQVNSSGSFAGISESTAGFVLKSNGPGVAPTFQSAGAGTGTVDTVVAGTGIAVDATDPANPIVALSGAALSSLSSADSSVQPARNLIAGAGLTGGGTLAADRTFTVGAGTGITVNADDVALSAGTLTSLGLADTSVQPARNLIAGAGLTGGGTLAADRTFTVGAGTGITVNADDVALSAGTITSLGLADTSVQPARNLIAGAGLTGGGTLAADRTFTVGAGTGITVNADDVAVDQTFSPTWTGAHIFTNAAPINLSSTEPRLKFTATGGGTDGKLFDIDVTPTLFALRTRTDADGAGVTILSATRTASATSITNVSIGAGTCTYTFGSTGTATFSGAVICSASAGIVSSSGSPIFEWRETDQGTNLKNWRMDASAAVLRLRTITDAGGTGSDIFSIVRGATTAVAGISYGNATDNTTHTFLGTGLASFNGNVQLTAIGNKFLVKEGANAAMGVATLVGGTVVVNNTLVTANSRIFLTHSTAGGTVGVLTYTITAATSFTVTSSSALDTSTFNWIIIEPAP